MAFSFKVNGTDFTSFVKADNGLTVKRTDIDDDDSSGRDMSLTMHRARLGTKRTLSIKCNPLTQAQSVQLATALSPATVTVTYLDPALGTTTKTFYGTEYTASSLGMIGGKEMWENISFSLVEV